jgi:hypothetical protein
MRDLDSELTGLRDTLRDTVHQPPAEEMIKKGRRRVRRQQAQVAAVVAIIVAAGALPFLRMPEAAAPASPDSGYVLAQDFYDLRSGFALGGVCEPRRDCSSWFMTTSDGTTWERRVVPAAYITAAGKYDKVIALGTSKVVIEDRRSDDSVDRYYSDDSGRTWSSVSDRPDTTVQKIPEEAALETTNGGRLCRDGAVIAMLSDSGRSAKLASQPPIELTWCQPYPDPGGTRWVGGSDPRTRQPVVASTQDHGLTWQVTPLPAFTPPVTKTSFDPQVTVVSTHAVSYATVINSGGGELVAIFSSTDRGATWTQAWQASDDKQPTHMTDAPVAAADGSLWIPQHQRGTPGNAWVSTDGAKSFIQPPGDTPMNGVLRRVRAGYLSSSPDSVSTGQFFLSSDGDGWNPVQIPIPE